MENKSLWLKDIKNPTMTNLDKDLEVDVLIIGGGMAGISTAFGLKDSSLNVVLIDKGICGFGVSAYSTGKLTYLQGLIYHKLAKTFNDNTSYKYLKSQKEAIDIVFDNVKNYNIECNLEKVSSYVFTNGSDFDKFEKEKTFFKKHDIKYETSKELPIPFSIKYSIKVDDTATFNPTKYILALRKICLNEGIKIYEHVMAKKIKKVNDGYLVETDKYQIKAKKVVISCHYPFFIVPGFIPFRTHIEKSFIAASKTKESLPLSAINSAKPIHSFRYYKDKDNYFLYAGESSKTSNHIDNEKLYQELYEKALILNKNVDYIWYIHDIMTNDEIPLIGVINDNNPNMLIATGFNKWGMTNGVIAGKILSDIILEKKNEYISVFAPNRGLNIKKLENFFIDTVNTTKIYVLTKIKHNFTFYKDVVSVTNIDGKLCGIYTDDNGKRHIVSNICPHMKCNLVFNMVDKTWDCPCHGSRYDIDGNIIKGPSVYSIKIEKN